MTTALDPSGIRRVLLVRPRFLGDICLTLPALEAVRAACPGARIAYLVEERRAAPRPTTRGSTSASSCGGAPASARAVELVARCGASRPTSPSTFSATRGRRCGRSCSGARVRVGYPHKGWRSALYTHHARPRTLSATGFHLASITALGWPAPSGVPQLAVGGRRGRSRAVAREALGIAADAALVGLPSRRALGDASLASRALRALARRFLDAHGNGVALVRRRGERGRLVRSVDRAELDRRSRARDRGLADRALRRAPGAAARRSSAATPVRCTRAVAPPGPRRSG